MRRQRLARQAFGEHTPQRLDPLAFRRQRRVGRDPPLDCERIGGIELAVEQGMDEQAVVLFLGFRFGHRSFVPIVSIRRRRARASRDITVPTGTPVTAAISR